MRDGMRILVCGGRNFRNSEMLGAWLGGVCNRHRISAIIQGGASGADELARLYAEWRSIPVETYEADWKLHGRAAGPIRNQRMLDQGKPDLVIAFPGGSGTADMVRKARAAGIELIEVKHA